MMQSAPSGQAKSKEITELLKHLEDNSSSEQTKHLERLKVFGRDPRDAGDLFNKRGLQVLIRYGLDQGSDVAASRQALSCLANCMLLQPSTRQLTVSLGAAPRVTDRYQDAVEIMDEFLCARLLLLMTYNTTCDFDDLIERHQLCESIIKRIENHAENTIALEKTNTAVPSATMALCETLKLLFAVIKRCPEVSDFQSAVKPGITVLIQMDQKTDEATAQLALHLVDALHVLPLDTEDLDFLFREGNETKLTASLIILLDNVTTSSKPTELDLKLSSTLILLLQLHPRAPDAVKAFLRDKLLPHEEERDKPLGQSNSLPARLLRLSTSGYTPQLRELIPELFFELSDGNAETFVNNVGYGYASGYLQNRKIPFTMPGGQAGNAASGSQSAMRGDVNPVTGQFFDREPKVEGPQMTDEEKEREAERLFVLFERLKKTGIVDVKNPVEEAVQSGRFEELPDD